MNERDSEIIEQLLCQKGYCPVDNAEAADVVILNTCSIREKAEQKVFSLLGRLRRQKQENPALLIGVTGCVAQQEGPGLFARMPHVNFVVGTQQLFQLPDILHRLERRLSRNEMAINLEASFSIPPFQKMLLHDSARNHSSFQRFVTIMQGCNNYCTYCVVPYTRGREISRTVADIVEEVQILTKQGVREITLLGQNVNSYGKTNPVAEGKVSFADLLRLVAAVPGVERLRFTTSNPKDLSEGLMRCFAELGNLCPSFHLPVQSGSNAVLRSMNRKYTVEQYLDQVASLRRYCPDIALYTDIIVGFPGETDDDFEKTMDLLKAIRFHGSFSFKYSDRPRARSVFFANKVKEEIKTERLARFQALQSKIRMERNKEYIGKTVEVMVESEGAQQVKGRTATNHIVHFATKRQQSLRPGDLVEVLIHSAGNHSLKGISCPCQE